MKYLWLLLLAPMTSLACVHSIDVTDTYTEICTASDACRRLDYVDLPPGNARKKETALIEFMQSFFDVRLELNTFDPQDPDKAADPDCENVYWGDDAGTKKISLEATHLISRDCIIEDVVWDGTRFSFSLRRADRCL